MLVFVWVKLRKVNFKCQKVAVLEVTFSTDCHSAFRLLRNVEVTV